MSARERYDTGHRDSAMRNFATHQIRERSDTRWLLYPRKPSLRSMASTTATGQGAAPSQRKPDGEWDWPCWTEIIALAGDGLFVGGDIGPVVFRYGPKDPVSRVHWMGRRAGANDSYFVEKATIGMGGPQFVREWRADVASEDLDEHIAELRSDIETARSEHDEKLEHHIQGYIEQLEDLKTGLDDSSFDTFHRDLYETDVFDGGDLPTMGCVPSSRMYNVHAALARLSFLLREENPG